MPEPGPEELQGESAAISELRARLQVVQSELDELRRQRGQLGRALEEKERECDALLLSIRSLGGKTEDTEVPSGPRIEVRYRGGERPTIRIIARERAAKSGGTLKIRDLLRETRRLGFKSDQGGLHTYLKGLAEFIQSGPGEFTLHTEAHDPVETESGRAHRKDEAP